MRAAFRDRRPGDLPALEAVRAAAFAPIFRGFAEAVGPAIAPFAFAGAEAAQARLLADLCQPERPMLVAELDGVVVGFCAFSLDESTRLGEIGLNAVHPAQAGQGIGTALYAAVLQRMAAAGMRAATVSTGGDPAHAAARRAYGKVGFGAPIPAVSLYRPLDPGQEG